MHQTGTHRSRHGLRRCHHQSHKHHRHRQNQSRLGLRWQYLGSCHHHLEAVEIKVTVPIRHCDAEGERFWHDS